MDNQIRVLLVDDSPVLRVGLRRSLEVATDIVIIGEAGSGNDALSMIESLQPDLVILDCQLPDISGVQVAKSVQQKGLQTKILAFSVHDDEALVRGMVEAGAIGYLLKDEPPENIIEAVHFAVAGSYWFSPAVTARLAERVRSECPSEPRLTERETQVLRLLVSGKANKTIAAELRITERTARFHVRNIYDKISVHTRAEAAVWAVRHGLGDVLHE
jgi:two-component system nitrate/nitrite response regulator NarL